MYKQMCCIALGTMVLLGGCEPTPQISESEKSCHTAVGHRVESAMHFDVVCDSYPSWAASASSQPDSGRWRLYGSGIIWQADEDKDLPHYDHIEQTGLKASNIINFGVNSAGKLVILQHIVFPTLRKMPDDTFGSLSHNFAQSASVSTENGVENETVNSIIIDGRVTVISNALEGTLGIKRIITPTDTTASVEQYIYENTGESVLKFSVSVPDYQGSTDEKKGKKKASYTIFSGLADEDGKYSSDKNYVHSITLQPGETATVYMVNGAAREKVFSLDCSEAMKSREAFIAETDSVSVLETSEPELNVMYRMCKIRALESITLTDDGLYIHSPGGGNYYGGVWANDQCEYANPFFGYCGSRVGYESAVDCFELFGKYAKRFPIPSSIIALGKKSFFAFDRGDASMVAYGAARFALECGEADTARKMYDLAVRCMNYALSKKTQSGVIASRSDELETRYPSGEANLFTSCLTYDALNSLYYLAAAFEPSKADYYAKEAAELKSSIESYFGAEVEGYDTYRYYEGNDILRSWICLPLTVGIYNRAEETVKALFASRLWSENGVVTQAGDKTYWDRSTLYAFRGAFACGETWVIDKLRTYTHTRLLGEHVPYAVEAYPEGNAAHLSAESALYCRIFSEGLFGLRPTGLKSFELCINIPKQWDRASISNVKIAGADVDIRVLKNGDEIVLTVIANGSQAFNGTVGIGEKISIRTE